MKTILVPTDFTKYADYALDSAASLAQQSGSQLVLLHVIDRPLDGDDEYYENYHQMPGANTVVTNIEKKMADMLKLCSLKEARSIYELSPDITKTILRRAHTLNVDLIVMGAYGNRGGSRSIIGSHTQRIMQMAKMPVLIVKEKFKKFDVSNMVLASEFYGEIYKVYPKMKAITDLFDTKLHLLKVNTPSYFRRTRDSLKLMEAFANEFQLRNYTTNIYDDLSIEDGIINFAEDKGADLIAITPDGLWRLSDLFQKNLTHQIMKNSIKAILSLKTRQSDHVLTEISISAGDITKISNG